MNVHTNISLKPYLTMKLGGSARFMTSVTTREELVSVCRSAKNKAIPIFILGGGSNVIARDEGFFGIVVQNHILGFEVLDDTASETTIKIGAGENWDSVVARTVEMNLSGIEAMSSIPGSTGAAPVQNVGAYGQEIADTLVELDAYDINEDVFVTLSNADCGFSYRNSIFRDSQKNRYVITSVTVKLYKSAPVAPFYKPIQDYFDTHGVTLYTVQAVRDAVTRIRSDKLPDPIQRPNTGSFFKNAIVESWQLVDLQKTWPDIPYFDLGDKRVKIPTGWLIETAGLKGTLLHGMRVHDKNTLVLINESATGYQDLVDARNEIIGKVRDMFRITIEQEPLEL